jgi:SAM-dependent methyltransferase
MIDKEFLYILKQGIYQIDTIDNPNNPAPAEMYSESYFNADKDSFGFHDYRNGQWWEDEAKQIVELYNPKTVYEIGCGYGFLLKHLTDMGVCAFGSDISEYAIKRGIENLGCDNIILSDATADDFIDRVPFLAGEIDVLIAKDVIEHWGGKHEKGIKNMVGLRPNFIHIVTPMGETKDSPITPHAKDKYWKEDLWYYIGANKQTDLTHTALHERVYWVEQFGKYGYRERSDLSDTVIFPTHESEDYAKHVTLILELEK